MDSLEIARQQLARLDGRSTRRVQKDNNVLKIVRKRGKITSLYSPSHIKPASYPPHNPFPGRPPKFSPPTADLQPKSAVKEEIDPQAESEASYNLDSITIEWDLEPEVVPVAPTPQVVNTKIIWSGETNGVISTETTVEPSPSPPKKKRSEVDKLLGDEGVQVIMRDQQICVDSNGTLLNMEKASKTRHQRMRQEEPEKTVSDWNVCSMIVRRRSSSFSTDSFTLLQDVGGQSEEVSQSDPVPELLSPPKIQNLFQSVKAKINQKLNDSFDTIANEAAGGGGAGDVDSTAEPNNNEVKPLLVNNKKSAKVLQPETLKTTVAVIRKKATPAKKTKPQVVFKPKYLHVHSEGPIVRVEIPAGRVGVRPLSPDVCKELVAVLRQQTENEKCSLVLFGPVKFTAIENGSGVMARGGVDEEMKLLAALATFPKAIFVAVQGHVEGLGVSMLPLFDLTFAKYGTEFCCARDPVPGMSVLMSSAKVERNRVSSSGSGYMKRETN